VSRGVRAVRMGGDVLEGGVIHLVDDGVRREVEVEMGG
jgi:hypothetical protein